MLASVEASARRLGASGRWLLALPSSYVAGVQVIVRSLVAGHEPVVVDGLDVGRAAAADHTDTPPSCPSCPTQLHRIMDDPEQVAALARCHTVLLGGGPIDPDLRRRAEDAGVHLVATYGSSETAGGCVYDGMPLDGVGGRPSAPTAASGSPGRRSSATTTATPRSPPRPSSTAGSSPPTPAASTRTGGCRSSDGSTTS